VVRGDRINLELTHKIEPHSEGLAVCIMTRSVFSSHGLVNHDFYKVHIITGTTKRLMSSLKCRSVEVINNPARPGSNHREVNCINYKQQ